MMTNGRELDGREVYQIKVQGGLPENWSDWFNGMTITVENESDGPPVTTLTGTVDQSALHGILAKIRDLNLKLVSFTQVESGEPDSNPQQGGE
jgi:hypothetical protein